MPPSLPCLARPCQQSPVSAAGEAVAEDCEAGIIAITLALLAVRTPALA